MCLAPCVWVLGSLSVLSVSLVDAGEGPVPVLLRVAVAVVVVAACTDVACALSGSLLVLSVSVADAWEGLGPASGLEAVAVAVVVAGVDVACSLRGATSGSRLSPVVVARGAVGVSWSCRLPAGVT